MEKTRIEFFWNNPFDGTGMFLKITGNREYERRVNRKSYLDPVEASKVLKVSLVQIHRLIQKDQLKAHRSGNTVLIKMVDLLRYRETRRIPGRPRKGEPFLVS
jgi:excisionase family DNA binding protein